jgi:aspartokinase/homoserine dehydrogenase 1
MSAERPWSVHKFGGSSVADAACLARVADIVAAEPPGRLALVLSAAKGVTDALLGLVELAERRDAARAGELEALRARHVGLARELLAPAAARAFEGELEHDFADLERVLRSTELTRVAGRNATDLVAGYGELWSTRLFERLLAARAARPGGVGWLDARRCVVVEWGPLGPVVQWDEARRALAEELAGSAAETLVIPGFVARDRRGVLTTLGRNGSDFSASIFGALLAAREIQIWTDVDGVLSADPRRVPEARVIDALSYDEAMELAYFGAKVLHPQTMAPAVADAIPIRIRNTFAPEKPGSLVCARPSSGEPVKGITTIERIALLDLEGAGMIGVPGTAHRLFGALREGEISVALISQGSSEHSICCAVPEAEAERAAALVRAAFERELAGGQIQDVGVHRELAILAVVGDGMPGLPGVAAKVFRALAQAGVNVRAIAQGASERNISVVVEARDATRALRAVHAGFYLSPHTLSIGLVGPGQVGGALLDQLAGQRAHLAREFGLELCVRAVAGSRWMVTSEQGFALDDWRGVLERGRVSLDLEAFAQHVQAPHLPHAVVVDCTASEAVARRYAEWLARGIHVVTPNKKAGSVELAYARALAAARRAGGTHFLYETTVGAGLPVIQTLRDLRQTGDEVRQISGLLSGSLAFLFHELERHEGRRPFSALLAEARARGYTEPDPRDDLAGTDFARKLILLGRELGLALELADVAVESLVPRGLEHCSVDEFLARLPEHDAAMAARLAAARARGKVLRYLGELDAGGAARVGLVELDPAHPCAQGRGSDNLVRYATRRYHDNPLVVQGPGAGPEVTAGGVFADLLRLATYLGARL